VQEAVAIQDAIRWTNLVEGCVAKWWEDIQSQYYAMIGSKRSGQQWMVAIIQKMRDVTWDLWEQRNGIIHSKENEATLHNMEEVDVEIWYQFQQGLESLPQ
jgi:hypothetical protein